MTVLCDICRFYRLILVPGYRFIEVFNGNENKKAGSFLTLPDVQLLNTCRIHKRAVLFCDRSMSTRMDLSK
jgi:hypothetical protein